jgi:uncharacterized protein (TIGR03118 family)
MGDYGGPSGGSSDAASRSRNSYAETILVSDGFVTADTTDANLVNAWGIAASAAGPWWVSDNHSGKSTLYNGTGAAQALIVDVPGDPTGIVFYGGTNFIVSNGVDSGSALFLFASEDGTISGWSPGVPPPPPSTQAQVVVNNSASGAIYKGIAYATTTDGDRLYATDFHNGKVDVFDGAFAPVSTAGAFVDPKIPRGYAPFGIQNIAGHIFVTYAKQDANKEDDLHGQGLGFISVFDTSGQFLSRLVSHGRLNAPWGMALAPDNFGKFSGDLLVGNFGDGKILAYQLTVGLKKGLPRGILRGQNKKPIVIDGIWGIGFGNGASSGATNALYFAAGPQDETHGLFGKVEATQ